MSLIDRSYFAGGELNLPGLNRVEIQENIDMMILKREPELLTYLFGVKMYDDLIQGLGEDPIQQKWTDLLQGVRYEPSPGRYKRWRGLVSVPFSTIGIVDATNTISVVVGRGGTYDPVAGASSVTLPAALVGKQFTVELRAIGQLLPTEYSVVGNTLTLLPVPAQFIDGEVYFYKMATLAANQSTGDSKQSLIANYVYYWYVRKMITQTTTVGEVKTKTENATRVIPSGKMERAWNEMVGWIHEMYCFLETRPTDYPSLVRENDRKWRPINSGNL
jgi:hypothetical protein